MSRRKIIGITVLVILAIIVLGVIFFIIDKSRAENNEKPIFTKHMHVYITDCPIEGYETYLGLGYKIIIVKISDNENYTKIGPIWMEDNIHEAFSKIVEREKNSSNQNENTNRLENLPQNYSLEQAVQDGCVVITYKKIYNKDILDRFIQNTGINSQNRIEDKIRIVQYTVEGDTIITDVEYKIKDETYLLSGEPVNKTTYIVRKDNTRDEFAAESDRIITENDNIPGEIYGITTEENGDMVYVELALYAEINYVDSSIKPYENIEICAYSKSAEIINYPRFIGTIRDVREKFLSIEPNVDEEIRKSEGDCDNFIVSYENQNLQKFKTGMTVQVTYTGTVRESAPPQINATHIEPIFTEENYELE